MTGTMPAASGASSASSSGTTYATAQDYIDSLNSDTQWVQYDSAANTAKITSLSAFAQHCKTATKGLGAFDEVDRGQGENNLFGNGQGNSYHFDAVLAKLLKDNASGYSAFSDWNSSYPTDYETDLALKDELGTAMQTRVNMPFLCAIRNYTSIRQNQYAESGVDRFDLNLGIGLSVALSLAIAFFRLHLVDADLLAAAVLHHIGGNDCAVHGGSAENGVFTVNNGQNLVKLYCVAGLYVQLLNEDDVALRNAVLLAAGFDNCVLHACFILSFRSRCRGRGACPACEPIQCGLDSI